MTIARMLSIINVSNELISAIVGISEDTVAAKMNAFIRLSREIFKDVSPGSAHVPPVQY